MTRIDFYILLASDLPGHDAIGAACRLCEKAVGAGKHVYVHAPPALADELDGALWSFRQGSFIAHEIHIEGNRLEAPLPPVLIGQAEPPDSHADILLNLSLEVPPFFSRFERVLEVVAADPAMRAPSRERFRYYRERGHELHTYEQAADGSWKARAN